MQTIKLDISQKNNVPLLYVKQRDVGHKFAIELYENGTPYTVDENFTVAVWYSGTSGEGNYTHIGEKVACEIEGNKITVEMIVQMLNESGGHEMCVVVYGQNNEQNGFWNIPYYVEAIPGADSEGATAYYQAFLQAQEKAEEAAGRAEDAAAKINVDQEYIDIQVFSAGQSAEIAATAARDAQAAASRAEAVAIEAVSYNPQVPTPEQQAQARENIGALELPCIKGNGAPTTATEGAVGIFYMDTDTGDVYKCTAIIDGMYVWKNIVGGQEYVTPVKIYKNAAIYVVTSSGKLFCRANNYLNTAIYRLQAGKKYHFIACAVIGTTETYALANGVYEMPESGFNTGYTYTDFKTETPGWYQYTITPDADCFLYVQTLVDVNHAGYADPLQNLTEVVTEPHATKFTVADDGNGIEISYGYGEDVLTVLLNKRGGNNLFDFRKISTLTETIFDVSSSDWHSPFIVEAVNNADGDAPDAAYFTGGNHQTNNTGTGGAATARTSSLTFFADGKLLSAGNFGTANTVEMRWTNMVQGYNTSKADGSGREILQENHVLKFVNGKFEAYVELIPLEDVKMGRYYGFQGITGSYPKIRYIGGTNRGEYEGASESGDLTTYLMDCHSDTHRMRIEIDPMFDLGKRTNAFVAGTAGAFSTDYGKCYFTVINKDVTMTYGNAYYLRGSWEFTPV